MTLKHLRLSFFGMNLTLLAMVLGLPVLVSCATVPQKELSVECQGEKKDIDFKQAEVALNQISELYNRQCFEAVIAAGSVLREEHADKFYEVSSEIGEAFSPEGSLSPYVLESHERTFLSVLIAASFYKLDRKEEAEVELRRSYEMSLSKTYNQGEDLPTILLQAVLWEKINKPDYALPLWRRAAEWVGPQSYLSPFILSRMNEVSSKNKHSELTVYGYGEFPSIAWGLNWRLKNSSYYEMRAIGGFPEPCITNSYAMVPTESWYQKIELRYAHNYHPLMNAKSWLRLPVGATYALMTGAAGLGVGLGGCVGLIAAGIPGDGAAQICQYTFALGNEIAKKSPKVLDYTLKPDLRHWEKTPMAFLLVREDESVSPQLASAETLKTNGSKSGAKTQEAGQCRVNHLNHVSDLTRLF